MCTFLLSIHHTRLVNMKNPLNRLLGKKKNYDLNLIELFSELQKNLFYKIIIIF